MTAPQSWLVFDSVRCRINSDAPHSLHVATADLRLAEAADEAFNWWDEHRMLDDLDLHDDLEAVLAAARQRGLRTTGDLLRDASGVIAAITATTHLTTFTSAAAADRLHRFRNTIAALLFTAEVTHAMSARAPYSLIAALPGIAPRHGSKRRPLYDDEVLLTRASSLHSLHRGGRHVLVATQYALAESGAYPMETTSIRPVDFDSVTTPSTVCLPGVSTWSTKREVRLTPFAARLLAEGLDRRLATGVGATTSPLCYRGEGQNPAAKSASSGNNLKNHTKRVGVTQPALEGSATTRWRIHKELRDKGPIEALRLMGKVKVVEGHPVFDVRRVHDFLNLPPDITPTTDSVDHDYGDFQNLDF